VKEREIPLQVPSPQPIETAEDLLFLQRRWVTADIDRLYALLNPLVSFEIEPEEGLLLMEFSPQDEEKVLSILEEFGCRWTPLDEEKRESC